MAICAEVPARAMVVTYCRYWPDETTHRGSRPRWSSCIRSGATSARVRGERTAGPSEISKPVIVELIETTGAIVIGRGAYGTGEDSGGWDDTPYAVPHFVITHRPPAPVPGRTVEFVFVTDGVAAAIDAAKDAAGDRYVTIGGGADIARQALSAGLVDELQLHVVPILVGDGVRLFDSFDHGWQLSRIRVIDGPVVTHLRYRIDGPRSPAAS
jgi:dihydrofolate reductase